MTVCFFFDRINYMNSKKRHGRFNTFYGRFMTVRPFFWENRVLQIQTKEKAKISTQKKGGLRRKNVRYGNLGHYWFDPAFTCSLDHLRAAEVCGDGRKYPKCHESDRSADFLTF